MRSARLLVVDYDAGTKVPGAGASSGPWSAVIDALPAALRARIAGRAQLLRSQGRYIPSMVRFAVAACLTDGLVPVVLGGDHSLSYSTAWAVRETVGEIDVVHADAHHDSYRVPYLSNYSFAYHASVDFGHTWHGVGWRHEPEHQRPLRLCEEISGPSWLTFDFDYYDPAIFPEVRFPVGGDGGTIEDLAATLGKMRGPILGVDLLEWLPGPDAACRDMATATVALTLEAALR
ncbi:MAG TPA: arginase family protein [Pseudonocardiaceae bacterium]|nr:arginase family protein [Pseudonocardiaceae bacterium]